MSGGQDQKLKVSPKSYCDTDIEVKAGLVRTQDVKLGPKPPEPPISPLTASNDELIDHPDYYNQGNIEVIDFIEDQTHLGFCRQIAIKYICRSGKKGGETKEKDLKKAIYYLEREMGYHRKGENDAV